MRLTSALRSVAVASLLFSVPVLAAPETAPAPQAQQGDCDKGKHKGFKWRKHEGRLARMDARLDRAVAEGRLTQAQADQFKAEGRQLREEIKAQREASGGQQLSEEKRNEIGNRLRAFREKVKAATKKDKTVQQPAQQQ